MSHTPGPWTVSEYLDDGRRGVVTSDGGIIVSVRSTPMLKADADLIAAAPDLLEACKRAMPYLLDHIGMTRDEGPGDRIVYDLIEAAIKKAEAQS